MKEENKNLTPTQKQQIPLYRTKWTKVALSTQKPQQLEIREAVKNFYQLNNQNESEILFFDSPGAALNYLLIDNSIILGTAIGNLSTLSELKTQIINKNPDRDNEINIKLKQELFIPIQNIIEKILEPIQRQELGNQFTNLEIESDLLKDKRIKQHWMEIVGELLEFSLTKETCIQLISNPQSLTKIHPEIMETWQKIVNKYNINRSDSINKHDNLCKLKEIKALILNTFPEYRGNVFFQKLVSDCAVIDFKMSVLNYSANLKKWKILENLVKYSSWILPFEKTCLVCARPSKILLNSQQQLHAEAESAIEFADGWLKKYYYHGVLLPEKYGKVHPNKWQSEWLLSEKNAHLRRMLIQKIGYSQICEELSSVILDSWQEYELLKIEENINSNEIDIEPIVLLKMVCPSTNKIHVLRVPPKLTSAREAIQWVNWGIDPEDFTIQT